MRIIYIFFIFYVLLMVSCSSDDSYSRVEEEEPIEENPEEDVVNFDVSSVPYQTLSEYNFYEGSLKNLEPVNSVLLYDLITPLFTDYAKKKRFVWMPNQVEATYATDDEVLNFPNKTVLIKNFYYENVLPELEQKIIETRLLFKRNGNWEFANYVWNEEQTEAYLDLDGSYVPLKWEENGIVKSTNYRIPSGNECVTCHKTNEVAIPIGPKPQNLNRLINYTDGQQQQLQKWVDKGFLENFPSDIVSVKDWTDESESLQERVRSYLDINCAHCHSENAHCSYRALRLAYSETNVLEHLGVCLEPEEYVAPGLPYIVMGGNKQRSNMYYRLNTEDEASRMPLLGRTLVHEEGVQLVEQWINSIDDNCQ
ncbi:hypothetical protein [Mesonia sp.]|uniref:hypothetical protein n=1 Tax=Mesonia sp. TaxID=1960830 RepID=UPI00175A4211|nr:hypothetical protein [Mesonia sp.]HIB36114.1 hypothetical protein [Mesonia sp.]HIO28078.1 hypothetical protein [Flavobacteriaceae bacterium]